MTAKIRMHERPAPTYARTAHARVIPPESYGSALDRVRQTAKTRAGMVCGVVIAALVLFVPGSGSHGQAAAVLAILPALVIAAVAFPLIAWAAKRDEARLRSQHDIRRRLTPYPQAKKDSVG